MLCIYKIVTLFKIRITIIRKEKFLKGLPKYELYKELDGKDEISKYSSFCSYLRTQNNRYEGINELCYIFAKNLITLPEILKNEPDYKERCRYITFWIHDQIRKKYSIQVNSKDEGNNIIRKFYVVLNKIYGERKHNNCFYAYQSDSNMNIWKQWKDLYDFIKNYDAIKESLTSNPELCKIYPTYLSYIEGIYKNYKTECCSNNGTTCPFTTEFRDWCNNSEFLNSLTCNATEDITRDFRNEATLAGSIQELGIRGPISATDLQSEHYYGTHGEMLMNKSDYYIKLAVGFSLLSIFSTVFFLYKFTTFGTWMRSKVLKQKINVNLDEDSQNLIEHELNNVDKNIYNDGYNITYNAS
ncbi:PIR protein [Plasmodium ovale]|uniref:PIR protein n=1 Tax=Plasmodium ovale TaxID=36330 RepID=A0A1D3JEC8_PLAOA|nr:PIR protein [Plasmodium ovale]